MEIKELETQTEREMATVILEQVLEIRKLRLALKAHEDVSKVKVKVDGEEKEVPLTDLWNQIDWSRANAKQKDIDAKSKEYRPPDNVANGRYVEEQIKLKKEAAEKFLAVDPMAVDVRSVV